jgi:four helix bundle protein
MEKMSDKDKIRFIDIGKGSTAEFITQVYIAVEIDYIDKQTAALWIEIADHILRMLTNLQKNLKRTI